MDVKDADTAYLVCDRVGAGAYGDVYRAVSTHHPAAAALRAQIAARREGGPPDAHLINELPCEAFVAIKRLKATSSDIFYVLREVSALKRIRVAQDVLMEALRHNPGQAPRVESLHGATYCLRLLDVVERKSGLPNIVTELCLTSLAELLNCKTPLPLCCARTFTAQLLAGLAFLHEGLGIIHRDIKPSNLMLQLVPVTATVASRPAAASTLSLDDAEHTPFISRARRGSISISDTHLMPSNGDINSPVWVSAASRASPPDSVMSSHGMTNNLAAPSPSPSPDHTTTPRCLLCGETPMPFDEYALPDDHPLPEEFACLLPQLATAKGAFKLELRIGDFGSACFLGPQPAAATHLRSAQQHHQQDEDPLDGDDNAPLLPLGCFPRCFSVPTDVSADTRGERHTTAAMPRRFGDKNMTDSQRSLMPPPLRRARITHGWTTLPYRSPEDMLSDTLFDQRPDNPMAPQTRLGTSIDVWSAGCTFAEMLKGFPLFLQPFNDRNWIDFQWPILHQIQVIFGSPLSERAPECAQSPHASRFCTSTRCWPGIRSLFAAGRAEVQYSPEDHRCVDAASLWVNDSGSLALCGTREALSWLSNDADHGPLHQRLFAMDRGLVQLRYATDIAMSVGEADALVGLTPRSSPSVDFLVRLLLPDPSRRITASEALLHQVLTTG